MSQALKLMGWLTSLSASGRKVVPVAEIERIVRGALDEPTADIDVDAGVADATGNATGDALERVEELIRYLRNARSELAALGPNAGESHYRDATDELDEIVRSTEVAAGAILDAAEEIDRIAGTLEGEAGASLTGAATRIYEASNFQDLTGQRVTKVVRIIRHIEEQIGRIVVALGGNPQPQDPPAPPVGSSGRSQADQDLLNGPQATGKAKTQDDVDALFSKLG